MAKEITLTLDSGAGADLGPNFNVTVDLGTISPTSATKTELLSGKIFEISTDDFVTVTVTSTGNCTNGTSVTVTPYWGDCGVYSITDEGNIDGSTFQYYEYPSGTFIISTVDFDQTINFQAYENPAPEVTSGDAFITGPSTCII